ncbi:MAG TPA: hypothetical protein VI300_32145 [Solirubrobacter sp.]
MRHTIVIEVADHVRLSPEEIEEAVTGALLDTEMVYAREIHRPVTIVEYHHEQMTEPADGPYLSDGVERVVKALVDKNRERGN